MASLRGGSTATMVGPPPGAGGGSGGAAAVTQSDSSQQANSLALAMEVTDWLNTARRRRRGVYTGMPIAPSVQGVERDIVGTQSRPVAEDTITTIAHACRRVAVCQMVQETDRVSVYRSMQQLDYDAGEDIIREGEAGKNFYVLFTGEAVVTEGKERRLLNRLKPGDAFGEVALYHSCPRSATVTAVGKVTCFAITRDLFQGLLRSAADIRRREYMGFLEKVPLLQHLSSYQRQPLTDALVPVEYPQGTTILQQGVVADNAKFHIIAHGVVSVHLSGSTEPVKLLTRGDFFGEISLLRNSPPTATVVAKTLVKALTLDRDSFVRLLGPVEHIISGHIDTYKFDSHPSSSAAAAAAAAATEAAAETESAAAKIVPAIKDSEGSRRRPPLSVQNFEIYEEIGRGFIGAVYLCKYIGTGAPCVLKVMRKAEVIRMGEVDHILSERASLVAMSSPFVVEMFGSFQDDECLYIAMEYITGGELFNLLERCDKLPLDAARFYACEVLAAIEYIHKLGFVYRDLKPENVLIDRHGHIKLVDMGFARRLSGDQRCYTFCGTPDYLCPEILRNIGHGMPVDFWAFGVLLYEMLVGTAPFTHPDPENVIGTYENILSVRFTFPENFDPAAADLISRLLVEDTTRRLGAMAAGIDDIKSHAFFGGIEWDTVHARRIPPPYIPPARPLPTGPPRFLPRAGDVLTVTEQALFRSYSQA